MFAKGGAEVVGLQLAVARLQAAVAKLREVRQAAGDWGSVMRSSARELIAETDQPQLL